MLDTMIPYPGTPDAAWPPNLEGWDEAPMDPEVLAQAGLLSTKLPLWHECTSILPSGMFRFFCYDTAAGARVGALKYVGVGIGAGRLRGGRLREAATGTEGLGNSAGFGAPALGADVNPPDPGLPPPPPIPPPDILPGGTSGEPQPAPDADCSRYVARVDPTGQATAIATDISYNRGPVPWQDGSVYKTRVGGQPWAFAMWSEDGMQMVSTWSCAPGGGGTGGDGTSGGWTTGEKIAAGVIGAVLVVGAIGAGLALAGR